MLKKGWFYDILGMQIVRSMSTGKVKKDFNLIEAYDMTLEATVTKLMFLMKKYGKDYKSIREAFYRPINYDIAKPEIG